MAEYIDRENLLKSAITVEGKIGGKFDFIAISKAAIEHAPAEDVEPIKHGKWLIHEQQAKKGRKIKYSTKQCSVCGKWNGRHTTNYCPNCGAKMDGDSNG